ncbi:MAG: T9SS type A sorting domain-containing protein [Patescibacteria group bacterium]
MKKIAFFFVIGLILSANVFASATPLYVFSFATPCLGVADGGVQYSKAPVEPDTTFTQGDDVYVLVELKNVVGKHKFHVKKFLNGVSYGEYTTDWKNPEEKWVWEYSYFIPSQLEARPGRWTFAIYFGDRYGVFEEIAVVNFKVSRTDPPYEFTGAVACRSIADGPEKFSKIPVGADSVFTVGDTVYVLVELKNVYIKHRFGVVEFRNDQYWGEYETDWKEVGFGWDYSYFSPRQENIRSGKWEFMTYLEKEGGGWEFLTNTKFTVKEEATIVAENEGAPLRFSLSQNYPNPFNPVTTVNFSIPHAGNVAVEIFNLSGQKVVTLVDGYQSAGDHSVVWDASHFSAGVYFYTVTSGIFQETKKMILLK